MIEAYLWATLRCSECGRSLCSDESTDERGKPVILVYCNNQRCAELNLRYICPRVPLVRAVPQPPP